jgi:transposase-like protein
MNCPKCGQPMRKSGRVRQGPIIKQKWICGTLKGCGHVRLEKMETKIEGGK